MVYYSEPVVVNHGVLYLASGCTLWCVNAEAVVVNHGV